ncbi:hypothetical protein V8B55DRAFT_1388014 [Mucor lusitanicus]|uniref:HMG box domain-containing protein n=1 Tax=Mucor lusitanicus CBS 277.49 TaxID=747725 RepID=A0A162TCA9_MUCCL|nr:hypothetical protein MUCCIDRAFT_81499 [Mucor lusitanicus CBS 277.49]
MDCFDYRSIGQYHQLHFVSMTSNLDMVDLNVNSLDSNRSNTIPGLSDDLDLAFSDDGECFAASSPIEVEDSEAEDFSDWSVRSKVSDESDNEELPASTKKTKQESSALKGTIIKHYNTPFSQNSASEYQPSNSEGSASLEASRNTPKVAKEDNEQAYQPSLANEVAKFMEEPRAEEASAMISSWPLSSSSSYSLPTTGLAYDYPSGSLQFNKETSDQLTTKSQDRSPQELTRMIAETWNKVTKEQDATKKSYTNNTPQVKRRAVPSANGFVLFNSEQYHLIQNERIKHKGVKHTAALIGKRWKKLAPEIKEAYHQRARKIRADWKLENPDEYQACMLALQIKRSKKLMARSKATL